MQMRLLREANEVGKEDLGEFHKKIYGCGPLQGPLGAGQVPLSLSWKPTSWIFYGIVEEAASCDFSPAALGWGSACRYQDVAYSTRATSCLHLHFFRGSLPLSP